MSLNNTKEKPSKNWLFMSNEDLKCADLIFDSKFFPQALYHLQQSNEKLVKALLLSIGILSPRRIKENWKMKSIFGFLPKQPASYGHRTTKALLSDLQKTVPSIEEFVTVIKNSGFEEKIAEFQNTIKKSKKGIQKLKKRPSTLIEETDQLEKEINAAKAIFDAFDNIINKIDQDIDKLDFQEIFRTAMIICAKEGLDTNVEPPNFLEIKKEILWNLEVSLLISISVSMASILDPLVSITRYPDSKHDPFNETNPYVLRFKGLRDIVMLSLEKAEKVIS